MPRKTTLKEFINKAEVLHKYKFDYSKVNYINSGIKVIISCPIHGEFLQTPAAHLRERGCPHCYKESHTLTLEKFIKKAKLIHGDIYDYSLVRINTNQDKVKIICKLHGVFKQTPGNHFKGVRCGKCFGTYQYSTEEFIKLSKIKHNNIYSYGDTIYKGSHKFITVTCHIHGNFKQKAFSHLQGFGCFKCRPLGFDKSKSGILYLIEHKGLYKIGITNYSVRERYGAKKMKDINIIKEIYYKEGIDAFKEELRIKKSNKEFLYNKINELTGTCSTEVFTKNIINT